MQEFDGAEQSLDYPPWVIECGKNVCRAIFPKAYKLADPKVTDAYKIGIGLGMMQAGASQFAEAFAKLGIQAEDRELTADEAEKLAALLYGPDSGLKCPVDGSTLIPAEISEFLEQKMKEMSLREQASFHQGIADAIAMMAGKNKATLATTPYSTMLVYWRAVDSLGSVEQLHDFLTKIHGRNLVGSDIKRTRQLCLRVGKRFQAPGRPKTTSRSK